jgi:hypothetical protein
MQRAYMYRLNLILIVAILLSIQTARAQINNLLTVVDVQTFETIRATSDKLRGSYETIYRQLASTQNREAIQCLYELDFIHLELDRQIYYMTTLIKISTKMQQRADEVVVNIAIMDNAKTIPIDQIQKRDHTKDVTERCHTNSAIVQRANQVDQIGRLLERAATEIMRYIQANKR